MSHLDQEYEAYQTRYEEIIQVLEEEKGENMTLKATVSKISAAYSDVDADLRTLRMKLEVSMMKAFELKRGALTPFG